MPGDAAARFRMSARETRRPGPRPRAQRPLPRPDSSCRATGALRGSLLERLVPRAVDRKNAVEARNLEDLDQVRIGADDGKPPVLHAEALHPANQHAEPGRVDEGRSRQVDHYERGAFFNHAQELLLELWTRVQVDLPGQR